MYLIVSYVQMFEGALNVLFFTFQLAILVRLAILILLNVQKVKRSLLTL